MRPAIAGSLFRGDERNEFWVGSLAIRASKISARCGPLAPGVVTGRFLEQARNALHFEFDGVAGDAPFILDHGCIRPSRKGNSYATGDALLIRFAEPFCAFHAMSRMPGSRRLLARLILFSGTYARRHNRTESFLDIKHLNIKTSWRMLLRTGKSQT